MYRCCDVGLCSFYKTYRLLAHTLSLKPRRAHTFFASPKKVCKERRLKEGWGSAPKSPPFRIPPNPRPQVAKLANLPGLKCMGIGSQLKQSGQSLRLVRGLRARARQCPFALRKVYCSCAPPQIPRLWQRSRAAKYPPCRIYRACSPALDRERGSGGVVCECSHFELSTLGSPPVAFLWLLFFGETKKGTAPAA